MLIVRDKSVVFKISPGIVRILCRGELMCTYSVLTQPTKTKKVKQSSSNMHYQHLEQANNLNFSAFGLC